MSTRLRLPLCLLLVLLQSLGCFSMQIASAQTRRTSISRAQGVDVKPGLQLRLSEGTPLAAKQPAASVAPAERLSDDAAQNVLRRLKPMTAEPRDEQDFALRDRSLPAPRAGKTILDSFPPAQRVEAPGTVATGPLEVIRYSPEGDVPLAPQLSVTFSQPMVAITSHQDTVVAGVPVKLTPQPQGRWRWVGAKTLLFETEGHFPMATEYTAEVSAGTKSATGATLAAPMRWKFATPPPVVKTSYPNEGPTTRDPLMFVEFDQRISPSAVADTIRVRSGNREWRARVATKEEVAADDAVSKLAARGTTDRWLAFRVADSAASPVSLPAGSLVSITIGPGTPSLEGPRKTAAAQSFAFRTYGPMRVLKHECGYRGVCSPFDQWSINFTNPINASSFEQSQVRVEEISAGKKPQPVSLKSAIYGNTLSISGIKRGRTSYRVTLDPAILDQFGQTLGQTVPIVFNVGAAPAALTGPDKQFVVLDPAAPPRFSVYSINHNSLSVRLYKVGPENWSQFLEFMRNRDERTPRTPPGRLVLSKTLNVAAKPDEMAETRIDLAPVLDSGVGQVFVLIEPVVPAAGRNRNSIAVWAQVTQIGLDAFVDSTELIGWATSLKDGKPIEGAQLSINVAQAAGLRSDEAATTRRDGTALISLPASSSVGARILVARKDRDVAILPENTYWWNHQSGWVKRVRGDSIRWFVFDDRKMYRPGEEVHVKGWIRRVTDGKGGDVNLLDFGSAKVAYSVTDSRDNEIYKGEARINALGGFDTAFKLPATMNLGYANMQLDLQVDGFADTKLQSHQFQVQEFRRPEFEVTTQASEGPHFIGNSATTTVNAAYYAGGGLSNAEVIWQVTTATARFTPPNRDDFTFGKWIPWWMDQSSYNEQRVETFNGRTDSAGKHSLRMDFVSADPPQPSTVSAAASVTDVNRQAWTSSTNLLVHPADLYVGIRSPRTFVQKGEPLIVQSIVADLDGKLVAGREIKMRAVLVDWVFEKGEWKQKETNPQECTVRSAADPVQCRFESKEGGQYRVTATIQDDRERKNESELTLWVAGGKVVPRRNIEQEDAQLIPDRKEYRAGDNAEILVQAPFYPAEGVLTLRRSGIVSSERFAMDGPSHTLRIPIEEGYTPNLYVQVDLVGAAVRTDNEGASLEKLPKRPAFAKGTLNIQIPPLSRKLSVEAKPRELALEPGGETTVDVEVRDATGKAVAGSELAVVVVDEAVLALSGYRIGDPISTFYSERAPDVSDHHLRQEVLLAAPDELAEKLRQSDGTLGSAHKFGVPEGVAEAERRAQAQAPMNSRAFETLQLLADLQRPEQIRTRENFNALATFAPAVPTDSNGRASVKVKLPDSLTRYRVMAVAVAGGKQFGANESNITARLPLMVRPSPPRFLNFGDKIELPVVVQNQTDSPMSVDVAVRAGNAEVTAGAGRRVNVPANDRVEVRFPVSAARAGTARFQIAGVSGKWTDAAEIELPVWTPATTEAFATYGEIDQGAIAQPVKTPSDAIKQFGGLEISTSSTELQALTDGFIYLVGYPFECTEQLSSRVLAVAALKDVLTAFKAKGLPEPKDLMDGRAGHQTVGVASKRRR